MVTYNFTKVSDYQIEDPKNKSTVKRTSRFLRKSYIENYDYISSDLEMKLNFLDSQSGKIVPFIVLRHNSLDLHDPNSELTGDGEIARFPVWSNPYANNWGWEISYLAMTGEMHPGSYLDPYTEFNGDNIFFHPDILTGGSSLIFNLHEPISVYSTICPSDSYKKLSASYYEIVYDYVRGKMVLTTHSSVSVTKFIGHHGVTLPDLGDPESLINSNFYYHLYSFRRDKPFQEIKSSEASDWVNYKAMALTLPLSVN